MTDADVRPQDVLTLADFVSVYSFFFGPTTLNNSSRAFEQPKNAQLSISEVAVQVLQEERWRGTPEQVKSYFLS